MDLIDDVKSANRITTNDAGITGELLDLIEAAKMDLIITGIDPVKVESETDPLIKRAIVLYSKAHFGFQNPDAERLHAVYELLRDKMSIDVDYMAVI